MRMRTRTVRVRVHVYTAGGSNARRNGSYFGRHINNKVNINYIPPLSRIDFFKQSSYILFTTT